MIRSIHMHFTVGQYIHITKAPDVTTHEPSGHLSHAYVYHFSSMLC